MTSLAVVGSINQSKSMLMMYLAVVGSINQSKSMLVMSLAMVGSINQSESCQTHANFLQRLTAEIYYGNLPQRCTMETSNGDLVQRHIMEMPCRHPMETYCRDRQKGIIRLFIANDVIDCSGEHQPIRILLDP